MVTHQDALWSCLLALAEKIASRVEERPYSPEISYCTLQFGETNAVAVNQELPPSQGAALVRVVLDAKATDANSTNPVFRVLDDLSCYCPSAETLDRNTIDFLQLYLPYCFLPVFAHKSQRAMAIAHFAQTLDGKIATCNGNSKWIGNPENLIHAHRMRALCDGIIVGANTVDADHPRLTVRHVEGKNPRRIVVCSSERDLTSLFNSHTDPVWVIGTADEPPTKQCQYIKLHKQTNGKMSPGKMLENLYQKGIHSVYVEGGPHTTSHFLADGALDVVQLHISPLILGSGMPGFALPQVDSISQAVQFESFSFHPIGNTYMFVGAPKAG